MESDLIAFIRSYREPVAMSVAAGELVALARIGAGWPRATVSHWEREFTALVAKGLLVQRDGMLSVPTGGTRQLDLFGE